MSVGRIIETDQDVAEGAAWLAAHDDRFAKALELTGPLPLRRRDDGYPAMLSAIVSQQLSVAAARGIWNRLEAAGAHTLSGSHAMSDDELRACGLSRPKIKYIRGLIDADVDFEALRNLPDDEVVNRLVALKGVGVWTAEIYAMFSLGRADVFAPGDLALQEAARILFDLPERPKEKAFRELAAPWSPWRSVAARLLWAYYHVVKSREGIT
ncbi:DNA-3-methyladenine glycosylase family protein [Pontivivens nitratireducens]|uniref:DNA-3-methyladenine glycosylase II n=1 Tax=Pontivivens nitratireducens TaxID=2758038 RepID=A0A6G7VLW1_9RHOB|nr:DNA-3-methyladenine glycosylase 2 family protein [Pontibrevibacter nitratireducens]QIK40838.1 DNA-3-methyladenine glycosylase 2 family protein [Pontibrevibacter nitratireducens]